MPRECTVIGMAIWPEHEQDSSGGHRLFSVYQIVKFHGYGCVLPGRRTHDDCAIDMDRLLSYLQYTIVILNAADVEISRRFFRL